MNRCTITASKGSSAVTVLILGHGEAEVPEAVAAEAARLASAKEPKALLRSILCDAHTFILAQPQPKPWLVGNEEWRMLGAAIIAELRKYQHRSANIILNTEPAYVSALAEGALLGDYRFERCRSGAAAKRSQITLRFPGQQKAIERAIANAEAQNLAREICDLPGNMMHPHAFILRARKELAGLGLSISSIEGIAALKSAGFPGLIQVGKAGSVPPALLEIRYVPKKASKAKTSLALVGKGITFDSGGISLKPGADMWKMKGDMGGAAAVLGAMKLIAQRRPKIPVTAYCALAENLPDSHAQRPGDIYRARNGTYIHVDNTDAEGRLVLSDVLTYACQQGASHIADVATLTGACLVALGSNIAALMSNSEAWGASLRAAGQAVGEELWPLPLYGEYRSLLEHPHADINNTGGRYAGTITAGLFLQEFVKKGVEWAHLDIAGPAMMASSWRYFSKGNTGFATRSLAELPHLMK